MDTCFEKQKFVIKCIIIFRVLLNFDPVKKNAENTMSHLYFNEEGDYSKGNTCDSLSQNTSLSQHHSPPQKILTDLLHTILEQEMSISANADIAKTKT